MSDDLFDISCRSFWMKDNYPVSQFFIKNYKIAVCSTCRCGGGPRAEEGSGRDAAGVPRGRGLYVDAGDVTAGRQVPRSRPAAARL